MVVKEPSPTQSMRVDIVFAVGGAVTGIAAFCSTFTCPVQHLRNNDDAELVNGTDLTIQDGARCGVVLNRDEGRIAEVIDHLLDGGDHLGTNVKNTGRV